MALRSNLRISASQTIDMQNILHLTGGELLLCGFFLKTNNERVNFFPVQPCLQYTTTELVFMTYSRFSEVCNCETLSLKPTLHVHMGKSCIWTCIHKLDLHACFLFVCFLKPVGEYILKVNRNLRLSCCI